MIVEVWSEIHCPWALVCLHRLRAARAALDRHDVVLRPRAWPLEWVNERGTPRDIVSVETIVLAAEEPELFSTFEGPSWPSTFLPAFELVAAARRVGGDRLAEEVDYALRLAFFRDAVDVSIEAGLRHALSLAANDHDLSVDEVMDVWFAEPVRADVLADYRRSVHLPIQGSPQVFWPDGSTHHNPGLEAHSWVRGMPRIEKSDPHAPAHLLAAALGVVTA